MKIIHYNGIGKVLSPTISMKNLNPLVHLVELIITRYCTEDLIYVDFERIDNTISVTSDNLYLHYSATTNKLSVNIFLEPYSYYCYVDIGKVSPLEIMDNYKTLIEKIADAAQQMTDKLLELVNDFPQISPMINFRLSNKDTVGIRLEDVKTNKRVDISCTFEELYSVDILSALQELLT